MGNPIHAARERANFAAALAEFAKAASTVERFWPEFGLGPSSQPAAPVYPFEQSFDDLAWDISSWAAEVRRWAEGTFASAEAWRLQQQTRADEAGIRFDAEGPELSICDHCGELYQFVVGHAERRLGEEIFYVGHTCSGLEAESQASAREDCAAHGDDR